MATILPSESRRLYSWWWDSHISPKNSKWLQDNLTDIDAKVKTMIKLIEEDADSFARRAEMYYKKRPELMKLVEEFYRAYRALAERYDHATGELRHAQKTMAAAFPNQVPFPFLDDSSPGLERETQTLDMLHPLRVLLNSDFGSAESKKGLKQLQEMFGALENSKVGEEKERDFEGELLQLNDENQKLANRASKADIEIINLRKALEDLENEKSGVHRQYEESTEKIYTLEKELDGAQTSSRELDEEVKKLKEVLLRLEAERDAVLVNLNEYKERISKLEADISEAHNIEKELSKFKMNIGAVSRDYEICLEKVSDLDKKLLLTQDKAKLLNERADRAENEVRALNKALSEACEDKEVIVLRYEHCLEKISKLESELSRARDDIKRLNGVVKMKSEKIKNVEEKCVLLETSNHALQLEADTLEKKITIKNEELDKKDVEIERVQLGLQSEHTRFVQAEATLEILRNLHSQAQREQKALALELKNGLKTLKEMDERKHGLEEEMMLVKDENKILNESNSSSKIVMENLEREILNLNEVKERLEKEVGVQTGLTNTLQREIHNLNVEIQGMNTRYQYLIEQIESVGINPESIESSVKDLQDENSTLREICNKERDERDNFVKKLDSMKQFLDKNATLESELEKSQKKVEALHGEKYSHVDEKAVILSQLKAITENMQKLLERNNFLENSLSGANVELLSFREKAKFLEELCKSLNNDKSNLLSETSTLVLQLSNVKNKLENLEKRYSELEMRYASLEKEKESTLSQVEELKVCLDIEKQERASVNFLSVNRLTRLEDHVQVLQEESRSRKNEFEEELDGAVNAQFEIFVLQKFIQDMEQKNLSLLLDCQKHVEAAKLSDKVISELENENLEQQVEAEDLLDEIEKLRMGIKQVFKALEIKPVNFDKMENGQLFFHSVVENIEDMKFSLANCEDDKDRLLIENSVFFTLFGQMKLEASEFELEKKKLQHDFKVTYEKLVVVQNEKVKTMERNKQLNSDLKLRDQQTDDLKTEIERVSEDQRVMKKAYQNLQNEFSQKLEENRSLLETISDLKENNKMVEEQNHSILVEALVLDNKSIVFQHFGAEKSEEVKSLSRDLKRFDGLKRDLEDEVGDLRSELDMKRAENLLLNKLVKKLDEELNEARDINNQLTHELSVEKRFSNQKKVELLIVKEKLKAKEELNLQLCKTVERFKRENEETVLVIENLENKNLGLSEENNIQKYEMDNLREFNASLEFEVDMLREEVKERSIREEYLSSELKEISDEFQMWEAEAEAFHFDLQISTVREVFLESKVQELGCVCATLANERDFAVAENEQMKQRVGFLESDIGGLKDQLFAYDPVIDSLKDNIISLEQNILPRQGLGNADVYKSEDVELMTDLLKKSFEESTRGDKFLVLNGISELQQLQNRIKEIENVVTEEMKRRAKLKVPGKGTNLESAFNEIEGLKSNYSLRFEKGKQKEKTEISERASQKTKPEFFEIKNGMIMMKDIPLDDISNDSLSGVSRRRFQRADDQILELWEKSDEDHTLGRIKKKAIEPSNQSRRFERIEQRSVDTSLELQVEKELGVDRLEVPTSGSESAHDRNKRKIFERLNSDSQKLKNIQTTVKELRWKLEASTIKKKKAKNVDFETVKEQLEEVEDTIVQLTELNEKLKRNVEENDKKGSPELEVIVNLRRKRVADQARKGSEKIGRLLVEVQKIQYMLLKLEDEKKSKKIRFSKSKTSVILRDFISGRKRSSQKRKKALCLRMFQAHE